MKADKIYSSLLLALLLAGCAFTDYGNRINQGLSDTARVPS